MQHSQSIMPAMQQQRSRCSNANSTKAQSWVACVLLSPPGTPASRHSPHPKLVQGAQQARPKHVDLWKQLHRTGEGGRAGDKHGTSRSSHQHPHRPCALRREVLQRRGAGGWAGRPLTNQSDSRPCQTGGQQAVPITVAASAGLHALAAVPAEKKHTIASNRSITQNNKTGQQQRRQHLS